MANPMRLKAAALLQPFAVATALFASVVNASPARAQVTETVLYSFLGGAGGGIVYAPVIADTSGPYGQLRALYGTTGAGGLPATCKVDMTAFGCGTVFKLTPPDAGWQESRRQQAPWTETVLGDFSGGKSGDAPFAGLVRVMSHNSLPEGLYGTTSGELFSPGTIFQVTGKNLATIWNFTGGSDGSFPVASLITNEAWDESGSLYGTAISGGGPSGCGTVFALSPPADGATGWTLQTLWSFSGGADGCAPAAELVADASGALYGTTGGGGAAGAGVVFKLTPPRDDETAWSEQIIHTFSGGGDGADPRAGLIFDENGNLYGTTYSGGVQGGAGGTFGNGVVFRLKRPLHDRAAWTVETIWRFSGGSDGSGPLAKVIRDAKGALYGTTQSGGTFNNSICYFAGNGVAFKLTPPAPGLSAWTDTTLYSFSGGADGCSPVAALAADENGALYGTTQYGGAVSVPSCGAITGGPGLGCGVVFRLKGTGFVSSQPDQ